MAASACVTLALIAGGCDGDDADDPPGAAAAAERSSVCPVTIANGSHPPDSRDPPLATHHGNGKLWTMLWPHGVIVIYPGQVRPDGSLGTKLPWWRGVRGRLRIEGRRLDGRAPRLRAEIPPHYGLTGFQPSGVIFPGEGCWRVTGRVGRASLTYVTIVLKASRFR